MEKKAEVRRFGPLSLSLIILLAAVGIISSYLGASRTISNTPGGGTLLLLGVVSLLGCAFISVGIASTRVERVEKKYHSLRSLVGKEGFVKEQIPAGGKGVVLVENELWSATSPEEIPAGKRVKIVNIEDLTVHVVGSE
jgi:membrane protein implicated in regulation of membrane protease activity